MPKKKKKMALYPGDKPTFCKPENSKTEDLSNGFKKRAKNKGCAVGKVKVSKVYY